MGRKGKTIIENFLSKIKIDTKGCWIWQAKIAKDTGYGHFTEYRSTRHKSRYHLAHRFSYQHFIGDIPKGLVIDHLCKNRKCVNPYHLEAITLKENILRGDGFAPKNKAKTHCLRGHSLKGNNVRITSDGRRQCKKCQIIRNEKHRKKRRGELCLR